MGLSIKHFIYDEDTNNLLTIPYSKFGKLFKRDPSVSLKEYAGKTIKYVTVIIQLENRKPIFIVDMQFHMMKIDKNGKFDSGFLEDLQIQSMKSIYVPDFNLPENVLDMSADFASKQFKSKYTWAPPPFLIDKIKEFIFDK